MKKESKKLPNFKTLDELVEFFDTHDMGEYMDDMPKVHFEVNVKKNNVNKKTDRKPIHNR